MPIARHAVLDYGGRCGARRDDVATAVTEAVTDSVINAGNTGAPRAIAIEARFDGGDLVVSVADERASPVSVHPARKVGAGLALIGALADSVSYEGSDAGARVTMRFRCGRGG